MMPIGLTFKGITYNLYAEKSSGEIMVVHACLTCGRISSNRIAGDDNAYAVIKLLEESGKQNTEIITRLTGLRIRLLSLENRDQILIALFGKNYHQYIN
jgi:hypothetical protein